MNIGKNLENPQKLTYLSLNITTSLNEQIQPFLQIEITLVLGSEI